MPEMIGIYPIYNDAGVPQALIHCYKGQEERCRRLAVEVNKTISAFNGEKWVDNTKGKTPIHDMLAAHAAVKARPKRGRRWH